MEGLPEMLSHFSENFGHKPTKLATIMREQANTTNHQDRDIAAGGGGSCKAFGK